MANRELEKVSANLIPKAMDALNSAAEREGLSRTDVLNRAVQLYDLVAAGLADGKELALVSPDRTVEKLVLI